MTTVPMTKSLKPGDFLKAMAEGALVEPIIRVGMVKPEPNDQNALVFSDGTSCGPWLKVPIDLVESVELLGTSRCQDHEHPLVRLHIKEPPTDNIQASFFAAFARKANIAAQRQSNLLPGGVLMPQQAPETRQFTLGPGASASRSGSPELTAMRAPIPAGIPYTWTADVWSKCTDIFCFGGPDAYLVSGLTISDSAHRPIQVLDTLGSPSMELDGRHYGWNQTLGPYLNLQQRFSEIANVEAGASCHC
jgi:hypothetical protein